MAAGIIAKLLISDEPSVRYKVLVNVMGVDPTASEIRELQEQIRASQRVQTLLSERDDEGKIPLHAYAKWQGAHWVLSLLADMGYPVGDASLIPLREQVYTWLLSEHHWKSIITRQGRVRRCASQEGNALYSSLTLGIADARADELARRLILWQWPDGGWNCDKNPEADTSSFMESLIPLRALALHARVTGNMQSKQAAERCAEVFLTRRLYKRQKDGSTIRHDFVELHYPCYWHYDILFGLKVIAEAGFIGDERCADALELLESKRLPDGGFPAEAKYYHLSQRQRSGWSLVDWGSTSTVRMNEFVTADALSVLKAAERIHRLDG
jgi:hypothetical protein